MILACIDVYIPEAYYLDIITVIIKMYFDFDKGLNFEKIKNKNKNLKI